MKEKFKKEIQDARVYFLYLLFAMAIQAIFRRHYGFLYFFFLLTGSMGVLFLILFVKILYETRRKTDQEEEEELTRKLREKRIDDPRSFNPVFILNIIICSLSSVTSDVEPVYIMLILLVSFVFGDCLTAYRKHKIKKEKKN